MNNMSDYVRWLAKQHMVILTNDDIKELTGWVIHDKQYQKFQGELIRRMKLMEKRNI